MTQLEKDIEQKLVKKVKAAGGLCLKWVCPGWAGVPDRIVLLPFGRVVFVELKRSKSETLRKRQEWWAKKLTDLGFNYWTVNDEFSLGLFEYAELRRTEP